MCINQPQVWSFLQQLLRHLWLTRWPQDNGWMRSHPQTRKPQVFNSNVPNSITHMYMRMIQHWIHFLSVSRGHLTHCAPHLHTCPWAHLFKFCSPPSLTLLHSSFLWFSRWRFCSCSSKSQDSIWCSVWPHSPPNHCTLHKEEDKGKWTGISREKI